MDLQFLSHINYIAVGVAAAVFFILGSFWFSVLFGQLWRQELVRHNIVIKEPTTFVIMRNMLLTFAANIIISFAMACLVALTHSHSFSSGLLLGLIAALGIITPALASVFLWEGKSLKLFLLDVGYPVFGTIIATIILSLWK